MTQVSKLIFSWTFVVVALVAVTAAVISFVVAGDPFYPPVVRFSLLALVCVTSQLIYDEVAGRTSKR